MAQSSVGVHGQPPARRISSVRMNTVFPPSGTKPAWTWKSIRLEYQAWYSSTLRAWNHCPIRCPRFIS